MNCLRLRHGKKHFWLQALVALAFSLVGRLAAAQTYSILHDFSPAAGHPQSSVIESSSGELWGTTFDGGLYGKGSIFILTPDGSGGFTFAEPYAFTGGADGANPESGLLQGTDGFIYGAVSGGTTGFGLIYRIDSTGSNFEVVHDFTSADGSQPAASLIQGSDGLLYGTTIDGGTSGFGTVYAFHPTDGSLVVIHNFSYSDGAGPVGSLLEGADGRLYGTTFNGGASAGGVVFKLDKSGADFVVLRALSPAEGSGPRAALIQLADGFLYGAGDGVDNQGLIFKLDASGNNFHVLHQFVEPEGQRASGPLIEAPDGLLYGTAPTTDFNDDGTVFRLDPSGANFEVVHTFLDAEGNSPAGGLLRTADGSLYGTAQYGGSGGVGSVFRLDASTGDVSPVHFFVPADASQPSSALVLGPGGFFYGTAQNGGPSGFGAVFKMDASGGNYTLLHGFTGPDGAYPVSSPIVGSDGALYGTTNGTSGAGAGGYGNVYRLEANGGNFSVLHAFAIDDGNEPFGGLIQASDGFLYGGTFNGGTFGDGVVYKLSPDGQTFSKLHDFPDGGPGAALFQAADGLLYGTTLYGGANGYGSVFRLDTAGGNFEVLHDFMHSDGARPSSAVNQLADGKLYGATGSGTQNEMGVLYRLDPSGTNFAVIHKFTGPDGAVPSSPPFAASDGFLYGTASGGGVNAMGVVFRMKSGGGSFTISHNFNGSDGKAPNGVIQGLDGALYGTAYFGGAYNGGVAFRLDRVTYVLAITKGGSGSGKVVSTPAGINCGTMCSKAFAAQSVVTLTPTPSANSLFGGWAGDPDCSDGSVTMTGDKGCTATFTLGPDLVVSALGAPASAQHGMSITVSDTTKNRGAGAVGTSKTKYYLSVDSILGPGDVLLGTRSVPALAAGALSSGSVMVTIPANQAAGSYFVIAVADANATRAETDETNNTRTRAITIQ